MQESTEMSRTVSAHNVGLENSFTDVPEALKAVKEEWEEVSRCQTQ